MLVPGEALHGRAGRAKRADSNRLPGAMIALRGVFACLGEEIVGEAAGDLIEVGVQLLELRLRASASLVRQPNGRPISLVPAAPVR